LDLLILADNKKKKVGFGEERYESTTRENVGRKYVEHCASQQDTGTIFVMKAGKTQIQADIQ
jgi:hypothetical protein